MSRKQSFRPGAYDPIQHNRDVRSRREYRQLAAAFRKFNLTLIRVKNASARLAAAMAGITAAAHAAYEKVRDE